MKIDEKYLDEKERVAKTFITATTYEDIALRELEEVRLMRLGLWAQDKAIPAMKPGIIITDQCEECGTIKEVRYEITDIKKALDSLPKDSK